MMSPSDKIGQLPGAEEKGGRMSLMSESSNKEPVASPIFGSMYGFIPVVAADDNMRINLKTISPQNFSYMGFAGDYTLRQMAIAFYIAGELFDGENTVEKPEWATEEEMENVMNSLMRQGSVIRSGNGFKLSFRPVWLKGLKPSEVSEIRRAE